MLPALLHRGSGRALGLGVELARHAGALPAAFSTAAALEAAAPSSSGAPAAAAHSMLPDRGVGEPSSSTNYVPDPRLHEIRVTIKAFELRYLQEASTTIRDLLLIHCAPKALPAHGKHSADVAAALRLPRGDATPPPRRTLYTVIRGHHVDKTSREQFERVVHRRIITHATTSLAEVRWLLDSLRMYEFTGVQVRGRALESLEVSGQGGGHVGEARGAFEAGLQVHGCAIDTLQEGLPAA